MISGVSPSSPPSLPVTIAPCGFESSAMCTVGDGGTIAGGGGGGGWRAIATNRTSAIVVGSAIAPQIQPGITVRTALAATGALAPGGRRGGVAGFLIASAATA